jgi:hypothetical protein
VGLDIYVGPLSRYYSGQWKTIVQQTGEAEGIEVRIVRPRGAELPPPDVAQEGVLAWRSALVAVAGGKLPALDWDEDLTGNYWTDKPDWNAYNGLALVALVDEFPEIAPPARVVDLNSKSNPFRRRFDGVYWARAPGWIDRLKGRPAPPLQEPRYPHLLLPELWLPVPFGDPFGVDDPTGKRMMVGSVETLTYELRMLNDRTLRADPAVLSRARQSGPASVLANLQAHALFGLAVLLDATESAARMRQPIKLDY